MALARTVNKNKHFYVWVTSLFLPASINLQLQTKLLRLFHLFSNFCALLPSPLNRKSKPSPHPLFKGKSIVSIEVEWRSLVNLYRINMQEDTDKGNPLFARESKGNPPKGVKFQHSRLLSLYLERFGANLNIFWIPQTTNETSQQNPRT